MTTYQPTTGRHLLPLENALRAITRRLSGHRARRFGLRLPVDRSAGLAPNGDTIGSLPAVQRSMLLGDDGTIRRAVNCHHLTLI